MIIWSAEFYENSHGGRPVESWLDSLTEQKFATMDAAILLRLFVHFYGEKVVLLLHGYDKAGNDSQRNQEREINLARKRLKEWKARTR